MARRNFPPIENRFFERVVKSSTGCWLWTGKIDPYGYGHFSLGYKVSQRAHRWSYEHFCKSIPEGLVIDHLCRVKNCVNPEHLEPVTIRINTLRGIGVAAQKARQTHCVLGHPLDENNTFYRSNGWRGCRICRYNRDKKAVLKRRTVATADKL
jgi:hypothetical protein